MEENVFYDDSILLDRSLKEEMLKQNAKVIWMTGLSGSGKSTLAHALEKSLYQKKYATALLDGDNIRSGLNKNLSFAPEDRMENIRRIAEVAKLMHQNGIITIASFISPLSKMRQMAKEIIGTNNFLEVYINTPLEVCESRDVKGLYAKARSGEIPNFTGISAPYEAPENPDIEILTENKSTVVCLEEILEQLQSKISKK